jgi:hypothetical protein
MNRKMSMAVMAMGAVAAVANAGVAPTGEFTGSLNEGWNSYSGIQASFAMFGDGSSIVSNTNATALLVTPGWSFFSTLNAYEGSQLLGDTGGGGYTFNFATPLSAFGAFFGTNSDAPGATADIYSPSGALLGSFSVQAPMGQWAWDGWAATGGDTIGSVKITPSNNFGGFVLTDGATGNPVPAPGAFALLLGGAGVAMRRRR